MKIEKFVLLALGLCIVFRANEAFAQPAPIYSDSFSYKKGTDDQVANSINVYLSDEIKLSPFDVPGRYHGILKDMTYMRSGVNKLAYSVEFDVQYTLTQNKAKFDYWITNIQETRIVCDKTQKETTKSVSAKDAPNNVIDGFRSIVSDLTDCVRDYVKKGEKSYPTLARRPYWYSLDYIVEDGSVSYFRVLSSSKNLPKEQLFKLFENYFTYAYGSGKAVIENKDISSYTIVAKGEYDDIHEYNNSFVGAYEKYDIKHIVTIQCRDGRIRATITIGNYDIFRTGGKFVSTGSFNRNITAYKPFGNEEDDEMDECLEKLEIRILNQFKEMQKTIDEGNNAVEALDDW